MKATVIAKCLWVFAEDDIVLRISKAEIYDTGTVVRSELKVVPDSGDLKQLVKQEETSSVDRVARLFEEMAGVLRSKDTTCNRDSDDPAVSIVFDYGVDGAQQEIVDGYTAKANSGTALYAIVQEFLEELGAEIKCRRAIVGRSCLPSGSLQSLADWLRPSVDDFELL